MRKLEPLEVTASPPATRLRSRPDPGLGSSGSWRVLFPLILIASASGLPFSPKKAGCPPKGGVLNAHEWDAFSLKEKHLNLPGKERTSMRKSKETLGMLPANKTWIKSWFYSEFAGSVPSRWGCQLFFCKVCAAVLWLEHRKEESRRGNPCLPRAF